MKNLKNQISKLLKEIEIMIKNNEKSNIDIKKQELDLLLQEYLKNFKQNSNSIQYKYNSFIQKLEKAMVILKKNQQKKLKFLLDI